MFTTVPPNTNQITELTLWASLFTRHPPSLQKKSIGAARRSLACFTALDWARTECTYIDWLCALSLCLGLYVSVRRNPCTQLNYGGDFTFKVTGLYQTGWLKHKLRASASEVSQKCDLGPLNLRFRLMRELNQTPNRFLVSIFKNTGLRRYKLAGESCSVLLTEHSFFRLHHSDRGGCQQAIWNSLGDV